MIGQSIFHYKILTKLGEGGMGVVYKAQDTKLDRYVALKFLPSHLTANDTDRARFTQEAKAAAAINHPNVCTIYDIQEHGGQQFIVMEYVEGKTLKSMITDNLREVQNLPEVAIDYATQIAEALQAAHNKGIVHRDIKSENIMVTSNGQIKVMDFGLAKIQGALRLSKSKTTLGTVATMSPEQARGEDVDHRTDIWSLGVLCYEMLAGEQPFKGDYEQAIIYSILNEEHGSLNQFRDDIPEEFGQILNLCLKKDAVDRFGSANELIDDLTKLNRGHFLAENELISFKVILKKFKRPKIAIPGVAFLLLLCSFIIWQIDRSSKINWAREEILPQIEEIVEGTYLAGLAPAYELAKQAQKYIPGDPKLLELISKSTIITSIQSEPPGANVLMKDYKTSEADWEFIGKTPLDSIKLARDFLQFKFEKEGYQTVHAVAQTFFLGSDGWIPVPLTRVLTPDSLQPDDMVRVEGKETEFGQIPDFFIDKFEVTNLQFKEFVDTGGYRDSSYWQHPMLRDGKIISWKEVMALFVDATGRPGPSQWSAGDYPDSKENYPVTGISWYEAAAYAEFVGKELPTITHWARANSIDHVMGYLLFPSYLYPKSNFNNNGTDSAGSHDGINFYGLYDMAGNAREWCWNETSIGSRSIRGGAWNDAPYMAANITQASAFDRSSRNGFRCVHYLDVDKIPDQVFQPWEGYSKPFDYRTIPIASDEIFEIYKDQFSYKNESLNVMVEHVDSLNKDWTVERVSFNAAYNNERIYANLYLPKHFKKPYQTLVFFPGSMAIMLQSFEQNWLQFQIIDYIMKNGRALLLPAYKGTFGRTVDDADAIHEGTPTRRYVEYLIQVVKDFRRSVDYLESRPDINSDKIGYYGFSWGGLMSPIITSVEERLKVSVLPLAGLRAVGLNEIHPAGDPLNYVTRVKIPTLILSGLYDPSFPHETVVKPMFQLLGTPDKDKKNVVYETDHFIPRNELVRETLIWLDKYLGPVNK